MEQHNIDKRFKDSLGNMSRQPSPDAWARLQAQMEPVQVQEEKKHRGYWLYIAAAITLLLASVATWQFSLNQNQGGPQLAATETDVPVAGKTTDENREPALKAQPDEMLAQNPTRIAPKTEPAPVKQATELPANKTLAGSRKKITPARNAITAFEEKQATDLAAPMVATTKPAPKKGKLSKEPAENIRINPTIGPGSGENVLLAAAQPAKAAQPADEVFDLNGKPVIVIVKKAAPAPAPELLAANAPEAPEAERDPVKLKNIFKQARNLKNGEGVNLQDLGLHASSKLAVETRNIQEKFSKVLDL